MSITSNYSCNCHTSLIGSFFDAIEEEKTGNKANINQLKLTFKSIYQPTGLVPEIEISRKISFLRFDPAKFQELDFDQMRRFFSTETTNYFLKAREISDLVCFEILYTAENQENEHVVSKNAEYNHLLPLSRSVLEEYILLSVGPSTKPHFTALDKTLMKGIHCSNFSRIILNFPVSKLPFELKDYAFETFVKNLNECVPDKDPDVYEKIIEQFFDKVKVKIGGICDGLSHTFILFLLHEKDIQQKSCNTLVNRFGLSDFYLMSAFLQIYNYCTFCIEDIDFEKAILKDIVSRGKILDYGFQAAIEYNEDLLLEFCPDLVIYSSNHSTDFKTLNNIQLTEQELSINKFLTEEAHFGEDLTKFFEAESTKYDSRPYGLLISAFEKEDSEIGHTVALFSDKSKNTYLFFDSNIGLYKMNRFTDLAFWLHRTFKNPQKVEYKFMTLDDGTIGTSASSSNAASCSNCASGN